MLELTLSLVYLAQRSLSSATIGALPSAASLQDSSTQSASPEKLRRGTRDGSAREQPAREAVSLANGVQNAFALAPTDSLPAGRSKGGRRKGSPAPAEGLPSASQCFCQSVSQSVMIESRFRGLDITTVNTGATLQSMVFAGKQPPEAAKDSDASPIASAQAWMRSAEQGVKASAAARSPLSRSSSAQQLAAEAEDDGEPAERWDATLPIRGGASLRVKVVDTAAGAQAAQVAMARSTRIAVNCRVAEGGLSLVQVCVRCCHPHGNNKPGAARRVWCGCQFPYPPPSSHISYDIDAACDSYQPIWWSITGAAGHV